MAGRRPRVFRERKDIFGEFSDEELLKRYRVDREGIVAIADLVRDAIQSNSGRNMALSPELKVAITLRYLATGKMQLCSSDDFGVSQPTICRIVWQTLDALTEPHVFHQFIKFPLTREEVQRKQREFMGIARFPGVVGVIDGTHIRIVAPREEEYAYINRKRYHSINVQVVFDANYQILDIVAKWPGSVHDSRILEESGLNMLFERNHVHQPCHLLGDSGYGWRQWLKTPYLNPEPGPPTDYNRSHKKTRSVVERGIGQWKRRFHILHGEIRVEPEKVCKIIYACAILHNICKVRNLPIPGGEQYGEDIAAEEVDDGVLLEEGPRNGLVRQQRDYFAYLHFK